MNLDIDDIRPIVESALREDIGQGDITSDVLIPSGCRGKGVIIARENGVIAGLPAVGLVFGILDSKLEFTPHIPDGKRVDKGEKIAEVTGEAKAILSGERTALNFLGHLSGIATKTAGFVEKANHLNVKIMDTRKTTPNLRVLEKYAVVVGGGYNHRMGLYDAVLIKDNHLKLRKEKIADVVKKVRGGVPAPVKIEVEVTDFTEVEDALNGKPDIIMLDNMSVSEVMKAVGFVRKSGHSVQLEVSGGITIENVLKYAETGVDIISIGALTHSVKSLDVSMEME